MNGFELLAFSMLAVTVNNCHVLTQSQEQLHPGEECWSAPSNDWTGLALDLNQRRFDGHWRKLSRSFSPCFSSKIPGGNSTTSLCDFLITLLEPTVTSLQVDRNSHKFHIAFFPNPYQSMWTQTTLHHGRLLPRQFVLSHSRNPQADRNTPCRWEKGSHYDLMVDNVVEVQESNGERKKSGNELFELSSPTQPWNIFRWLNVMLWTNLFTYYALKLSKSMFIKTASAMIFHFRKQIFTLISERILRGFITRKYKRDYESRLVFKVISVCVVV